MLEAIFLIAVVAVPLVAGAALAYLERPWWWAAVLAAVILVVFAIAPAPEEGEARVAAGDIVFLLFIVVLAAALAWVGALLGRRLARRRRPLGKAL